MTAGLPVRRVALAALVIAALALNGAAYMHARAMTRFSAGGARTASPEDLGWFEAAGVLAFGVNLPRPENRRTPADVGLPYQVERIAAPGAVELEGWYIPAADARTLVLGFHGYAASKAALLPSAQVLHQLGHDVLLVDLRGCGGSSGNATTLGVGESADVAAAVEFARRRWPARRIVLYGFSMGGAALLRAIAVDGVRPDAIIVEATFDRLLNTAKSRFHSMGLPGTPFAELLMFWGGFDWGFDPFAHNPADYARAVSCPALVLQGGADARVTSQQAHALAAAMRGPTRLIEYPDVPHMLIAAARPEEWRRDVAAFLGQL